MKPPKPRYLSRDTDEGFKQLVQNYRDVMQSGNKKTKAKQEFFPGLDEILFAALKSDFRRFYGIR